MALCGGCGSSQAEPIKEEPIQPSTTQRIFIEIDNQTFDAALENNPTADEFIKRLPLDITLNELNGNEKYCRFNQPLPVNDQNPKTIRAGDLMIYSGNCFVLFYESFSTVYPYTRLGRIENVDGLKDAVGSGNVRVHIDRK